MTTYLVVIDDDDRSFVGDTILLWSRVLAHSWNLITAIDVVVGMIDDDDRS